MEKINAFILAAGKGTRLNNGKPSDKPKVLYEVNGRPMVSYTLSLLRKIGIKKPVVIIGYKAALVKKTLGNKTISYVLQRKQLGTGHALLCAKKYLKGIDVALVMGGDDSSFYKPQTLLSLIKHHRRSDSVITLLTIDHPHPEGLGRILRDNKDKIISIIEEKEATLGQKKIKEVNAGCYCFKTSWLLDNLSRIKVSDQVGEYYITNLIKMAIAENEHVTALKIKNHNEWIGVNTPEQLVEANTLMKKTKNKANE